MFDDLGRSVGPSTSSGTDHERKECLMAKEKDNSANNKTFLLRVDPETMEAVEKWAADEFRSVNGQLQWIIAEALKKSGRKRK